ncbi:MAG: tetratricopeptide repeat protein, partial [Candidatus Hermodarchaeota archaeon]
MKQTNLKIRNLFKNEEKFTFLIGAGCSVDAPSNVPDSNTIKEELINYFCAESEISNILEIEDLKLEQLLNTICTSFNEDLKIFDFFGLFNKPNLQHFFLADCIKKGHFVMTTNFDFLIENALANINIPHEEILPVITEEDFVNYSNPIELFKNRFKVIYKIHCSAKNVITGEDTQSSLIKTIKALGSNKIRNNLFQIDPFKWTLLDNICNGRSLVIMGYSGLNDFDIIPTLKALKNLKKIIWINHTESIQPGYENVYDIISSENQSSLDISNDLITTAEKLHEISLMHNANKIYLINVNLTQMVKDLIQIKPKLSSEIISISLVDWLKENIRIPNMFEKLLIASRIYYELGFFNEAMRCSEIMIRFTILADVKSWKSIANEAISKSYLYQQKKPEAINLHTKNDRVRSQMKALTMKSKSLTLIGNIYYSTENFPEAIKKFEETLEINEKLGNPIEVANCLNKIADIHYKYKNYNKAVKNYNKTL